MFFNLLSIIPFTQNAQEIPSKVFSPPRAAVYLGEWKQNGKNISVCSFFYSEKKEKVDRARLSSTLDFDFDQRRCFRARPREALEKRKS